MVQAATIDFQQDILCAAARFIWLLRQGYANQEPDCGYRWATIETFLTNDARDYHKFAKCLK